MRLHPRRLFLRLVICLASLVSDVSLLAQSRTAEEARRDQWQKVDEIFAEMRIVPGAVVADIGAGDGFFTSRLARTVGSNGRVFAVEIDDAQIERLRKRLQNDGVENVIIVKAAADDPKLPERALDAALIVNAYHEMSEHQSVMAAIRRALKSDARLVIVEPVTASKRGRLRAEQTRDHEIDPEYVLRDARTAGFRVVALQDPFTRRNGDIEWLMALQPGEIPLSGTAPTPAHEAGLDLKDPALRLSVDEFLALISKGAVTIVDVRGEDSFAAGHIPGAVSIPLESVEANFERIRSFGKPVVTYCS
jgi:FkbM family methyltransferase